MRKKALTDGAWGTKIEDVKLHMRFIFLSEKLRS